MKLFEITEIPRRTTIPGKKQDSFPEVLRSTAEVVDATRKYYKDTTLDNVLRLYAEHNIMVADNVVISAKVFGLYKYREYDRTMIDGSTGLRSQEQYDKLKKDIIENGIKTPLTLTVERKKDGNIEVYLGEGNHRIKIAYNNHIQTVPVNFYYQH